MDIIDEINGDLCRLSKIRHEKMGDVDSGMYNYYIGRIKNNAIIDKYDRYLIEYVAGNIPTSSRICELGSGLGQVSMALNKMGYKYIAAYENDTKRAKYAVDVNREMGLNVILFYDAFQRLDPTIFDVIIANNLVNTANSFKNEIEIIKNWISNNVRFIFKRDAYDHLNDPVIILNEHNIKYEELDYGFLSIGDNK